MGVGEDEKLGNAISVTIVATGFNKDQQHEISNTEAKKIIHTLNDEQEATFDFFENKNGWEIVSLNRYSDKLKNMFVIVKKI